MQSPTVLVVEDENLVALDISRSLRSHGYDVLGPVATAEDALRVAEMTDPDLVLMDIVLRGNVDGVTAAAQLSDTLGVPVLFLTAHADEVTLERAKVVEPYGYLVKPFEERELHAAVEMALYRRKRPNGARRLSLSSENGHKSEKKRLDQLDAKKEFLRSIEFFADWEAQELERFAQACSHLSLRAGAKLQDSDGQGIPSFIVVNGRMAIIESRGTDKELIVALVPPADLFGVTNALRKIPGRLVARAERKSELLIIPHKTTSLLLEASSRLSRRVAEYLSERLRASFDLSRAIAYDDVRTRISSVLLSLLPHFGRIHPESRAMIIDITRNELARLTGSSVETVVRVLKVMEREGLVRLGARKQIEIVDPDVLAPPEAERTPQQNGLATGTT